MLWLVADAQWALAFTTVALLALLIHHLRNLSALLRWLNGSPDAAVPGGSGVWEYVFAEIHRFARQRAQQQQALRQALMRFRDAGEALPDGVVMLDAGYHIEWNNSTAQEHLGLDAVRDVGEPILNFIRQPEFIAYVDRGDFSEPAVLRSGRSVPRTLSVQIIPYGGEQKLLLSRDITELERVATMRRDFVANVSHELKTPLTVVYGFLETLRSIEVSPADTQRYLELMSDQARSMQRLVHDLLTLSALESDNRALIEEPVAIVPLLELLQSEAQTLSGGQHTIDLDISAAGALLGSESELHSAFGNLVSNAVRYTPAGGSIGLRWEVIDGEGVFSVADSGIGIDMRHSPRLTERFYRVDRSRSRATGGTGLGLAIVKHVLMRHQAQLEIESIPGKGSCFRARFPAHRLIEQANQQTPADKSAGNVIQLAASR